MALHGTLSGQGQLTGYFSDLSSLIDALDDKADKAVPGTSGEIALLDANGNLMASGVTIAGLAITTAEIDNLF